MEVDYEAYGTDQRSRWSQLIADVWDDGALRKRLVGEPKTVLKERGIDVKEGVELKVLENTASCSYLLLPLAPGPSELSEDDLGKVAGGRGGHMPKPQPKGSCCGGGPNASCSPTDPRGTI
jgi:Nitrile hydratase, alpha chain